MSGIPVNLTDQPLAPSVRVPGGTGIERRSDMNFTSSCYKCGGEMRCSLYSWLNSGITLIGACLECGYFCYMKETQLSIDEVNSHRSNYELKPLNELRALEGGNRENKLPTIDEFIGSDPNYTSDMTTKDYIRGIR